MFIPSLSFAQTTPAKSPPPDVNSIAQASRTAREVYKADLGLARTPPQQRELVQRLLKAANEENSNAGRYALLLLARDVAVEGGDVEASIGVVDAILSSYTLDPLKLKSDLAQALEKTVRTPTARADLIHFFSSIIIDAIQGEKFDVGRRIAASAQIAARQSDDASLGRQLTAITLRLRETETFYNSSRKAILTLSQNPADPAANLAVGKYYCYYKSDWQTGLPMLSQSSDTNLRALAARELATPQNPEGQVVLGDDWWTMAETAAGSTKAVIQSHAVAWYRKSLPSLTGLTKARVQKRLTEAQLAGAEDELLPTMTGKLTSNDNGIITLKGGDMIETPQLFAPPVVFRIVAQTEDTNIRIAYGVKQIIFNWEVNQSELRVDGGRSKAGAGTVPKNTWVTIDVLVRPKLMAISVDGQLRHEFPGDFTLVNEPLKLFTHDSTIRIKSVRVRQLGQ